MFERMKKKTLQKVLLIVLVISMVETSTVYAMESIGRVGQVDQSKDENVTTELPEEGLNKPENNENEEQKPNEGENKPEDGENKPEEAKPEVVNPEPGENEQLPEEDEPLKENMVENNEELSNGIDEEASDQMTLSSRATTKPGKWIQAADGRWWYRHNDGTYTKNGREYINGKWYFFNSEGWMMTGWLQVKGLWYYLTSSGAAATGWNAIGGKWYFFTGSGVMLTGWQKLTYPGANKAHAGAAYYNYFDSSGAFKTDSDYRGCNEGYTTFSDYRYTTSPAKVKYYSYCSSSQNVKISTGATAWNKNEVTKVSKASKESEANMYFIKYNFGDKYVLAQTMFYVNTVWTSNPKGNWSKTRILVDNDQDIIGSGTIAHEIGHAFGLAHRITNPNSIMCQTGNGRKVSTVQGTDLEVLRHIY